MRKKFIQRTAIIIAVAMMITMLVTFGFQTITATTSAHEEITYLLDDVQTRVNENNVDVSSLKETMNADYLVRARAFSNMIVQNPTLLESEAELQRIMQMIDVDELHVTDEDGIIRWGTESAYWGFDMSGSEQTAEFLPILKDKAIEIAQEPQPNGAKGILFQYIGVSRPDKAGIVQIGLQPRRLEELLANNQIGQVLERYDSGTESVFALNLKDNTVAWHPDETLIGKSAEEIGFATGSAPQSGIYQSTRVGGHKVMLTARTIGDYVIVAQKQHSAIFNSRNIQTIVLLVSNLLVVLVLIWSINRILRKQIVLPIERIVGKLHEIENGSLDTVVDVRTCPEFMMLSDGINAMVDGIHSKVEETAELMRNQQTVAAQIVETTSKLNEFASDSLEISNRIANGSVQQEASMQELTTNIAGLAEQLGRDSQKASDSSRISGEAGVMLIQGNNELGQLLDAMQQISAKSSDIKKVVKTIDDISFQTNILALNAAVEAARAGQSGKGFSVVADEVRNLAGKSAEAAKRTGEMITQTVLVMENGEKLAAQTAVTLNNIMESAQKAATLTTEVAQAAGGQSQTVMQIHSSGDQISQVIQENSRTIEKGRQDNSMLQQEIQTLRNLARQLSSTKLEQMSE